MHVLHLSIVRYFGEGQLSFVLLKKEAGTRIVEETLIQIEEACSSDMILGRISRFIDLKGFGGIRSSSCWDEAGLAVVYLAETPAGALLEVCVHTSSNNEPPTYTLLRVERPGTEFPSISEESLPPDWMLKKQITRELGDKWLSERVTALLGVSSAIVPQTSNYIPNPSHRDASLSLQP
jgi:RES domain-containing protein